MHLRLGGHLLSRRRTCCVRCGGPQGKQLRFEPLEERRLLDAVSLGAMLDNGSPVAVESAPPLVPTEPNTTVDFAWDAKDGRTGKGRILRVDADALGENDGSSWKNAFVHLQNALAVASETDVIWVAEGTYRPDQGTTQTPGDRTATFRLLDGLEILGGYAGLGEANPDARDVAAYDTILSGDLAGDDGPEFTGNGENSYHVTTGSGTDATAVLSGFTITAGNASGGYDDYDDSNGAGMINLYGDPTVISCTFTGNFAGDDDGGGQGGGMYNWYSNPTVIDSDFIGNAAIALDGGEGYGGGMANDRSSPVLTNSTFEGNTSGHDGGGMWNNESAPVLINVTFTGNLARGGGSGSYGGGMANSASSPVLTDSTFIGNSVAGEFGAGGGGMYNSYDSNPVLTNCTFVGNYVSDDNTPEGFGGGMYNRQSIPTLIECTFIENSARLGGAVYNERSTEIIDGTFTRNVAWDKGGGIYNTGENAAVTVTGSTFAGNSASEGGGIYNNGSSPTIADCTFVANTATRRGGGVYNGAGSNAMLTDSVFFGNSVYGEEGARGGGVYNRYSNPTLINCVFSGNWADVGIPDHGGGDGGAMYNQNSSPTLLHNTISGNWGLVAGGIFSDYESSPLLIDSILWGNHDNSGDGEAAQIQGGTPAIDYSCVQGWTGELGGKGNGGGNPLFLDPDGDDDVVGTEDDDLRLAVGSSSIDAGTDAGVDTDIDGNIRPHDVPGVDNNGPLLEFDMGAYEFVEPVYGTIRGSKWYDRDGDGRRDDGEPGLEGWTIYLDANDNGELDPEERSTTTDANGDYTLGELSPGTYTVGEAPQAGWRQTYPGHAPADTERVSLTHDGTQGNDASQRPTLSADGRFVVFDSEATNLVPDDTNGRLDVFVHDRLTDAIERVSLAFDGSQAHGDSYRASISGDGRYVAFASDATNLVPNDTNHGTDVFVHDRQEDTIRRISIGNDATQANGDSDDAHISEDGRYVTFESRAGNLVPGVTGSHKKVFVFDLQTGTIECVSLGPDGSSGSENSFDPSISADGRFVAFTSVRSDLVPDDTNRLNDIFVYDRQFGMMDRVTLDARVVTKWPSRDEAHSMNSSISADGRFVAFHSQPIHEPGDKADIFVYDRQMDHMQRLSIGYDGSGTNDYSFQARISSDGRYVAFRSSANNLVRGGSDGKPDIYVSDRLTGEIQLVSAGFDGSETSSYVQDPAISADGRFVTYSTNSPQLVPGDTNQRADVFVKEIARGSAMHTVEVEPGQTVGDVDFGNQPRGGPLVVSTTVDENDGDHRPGHLSLREALALAAGLPNDDRIRFHVDLTGGTITLDPALGQLTVDSNVEIQGLGAGQLAVDAGGNSRVFYVHEGVSATIAGLTIRGGRVEGDHGGGIFNDGVLSVVDAVISGNHADTDSRGGGIYNSYGTLTVTGTSIVGNDAGAGGGVYNYHGTVTLDDVVVSGNSGRTGAGVRNYDFGTMTVTRSTISENSPEGVNNYGDLTLRNVTISGNTGGGITNEGPLVVVDSTISGNTTEQNGGGLRNYRYPATIVNTTISGNASENHGGGIYVNGGEVTLVNSTITDNRAAGDGGGVFRYHGHEAIVTLHNTIVAGNRIADASTDHQADDVTGEFDAGSSHNLIGVINGSTNLSTGPGTLFGTSESPLDPGLGPLQDNGGPTFTHSLVPRSPARDAGSNLRAEDAGLTHDQRRHARFVDSNGDGAAIVDIGAFEGEKLQLGEIHGSKFNDLDGDGVWDDGELGLEGWTIYLDDNDNGELDPDETSTTTDADGHYEFADLLPGDYTVAEVQQDGWQQTAPGDQTPPRDLQRVSVASDGTQSDGRSYQAAISGDGRYVAFASWGGIFVYDRDSDTIEPVSLSSDGAQANGFSDQPSISADGRYVAFRSAAYNPASWDDDDRGEVFVWDRVTGAVQRVSVSSDGIQANRASQEPAISADGRYVAFSSGASNLVPGDANNKADVFVYDRKTGSIERVSVSSSGAQGNGNSRAPTISADGRYVAFESKATDLVSEDTNGEQWDVFVYDRQTETIERVSVRSDGQQGNNDSRWAVISPDGRYVAFASHADNFVPGDTNPYTEVFLRDRQTGTTRSLTWAIDGTSTGNNSYPGGFSADGRHVTFFSYAANLVPEDTGGDTGDVFVYDLQTDSLRRLTVASDGTPGNAHSEWPAISGDGRFVAFESEASNLVPGDTNGRRDIFVVQNPLAGPVGTYRVSLTVGQVIDDIDFGNRKITGPLDHFEIDTITAPQHVDVPFDLTITAVDEQGRTLTDFDSSVELSGWIGARTNSTIVLSEIDVSSPDTMEFTNVSDQDIDISGWQVAVYDRYSGSRPLPDFVIPDGTICPAGEVFVVEQQGDAPGAYPHFFTGREISWRSEGALGVLLMDGSGSPIDFMAASDLDPSQVVDPVTVMPGQWQGDQVTSLPNDSVSYQRIGDADLNDASDWVIGIPSIGSINRGLTSPFAPGRSEIAVMPTTAEFVDGVWTGSVTVLEEAAEMYLQALHDATIIGQSNTFDVEVQRTGEIHGSKFNDLDGDGVWDDGEPGLPNWRIYLDKNENGQWDADEPFELTDADGRYAFTDIAPGAYTVAEVAQDGWEQTFPEIAEAGNELISQSSDGSPLSRRSTRPFLSADGRYVTFMSYAPDLVPQDTDHQSDAFVYDRQTDTMQRVSEAADDSQGDDYSFYSAVSSVGPYVAIMSLSGNLVPDADTNPEYDIFVRRMPSTGLPGTQQVVVAPGQVVENVDFGNTNHRQGDLHSAHPGDANLDGTTDISDFNLWNANKFATAQPGNGVISTSTALPICLTSMSGTPISSRLPRIRRRSASRWRHSTMPC